jgi:hypothetical protein
VIIGHACSKQYHHGVVLDRWCRFIKRKERNPRPSPYMSCARCLMGAITPPRTVPRHGLTRAALCRSMLCAALLLLRAPRGHRLVRSQHCRFFAVPTSPIPFRLRKGSDRDIKCVKRNMISVVYCTGDGGLWGSRN